MTITRFGALACALLVLGACDDTTEPQSGSATAFVGDDPATASAAQTPDESAGESASTFSGNMAANAQVAISVDGETWFDLGSPTSIDVALQSTGDGTSLHANAAVPVGTYTRVRLVLSGASANVDAGAVIGGITLTSAASMNVGGSDGEVVIEKQVTPFTVSADAHVRVMFDLNSEMWVNEENAEDESAEDEEVEEACDARRQVDEEQE